MRDGSLAMAGEVDSLRAKAGSTVEATVEPPVDADRIRDIDGVSDVAVNGATLRLSCTPDAEKVNVLNRLDTFTTVREFESAGSSLESLFGAITGDDAVPNGDDRSVDGAEGE
ncbi:hypothetical protein [Halostella litorea]|uniref:hypothetical protein n=1 Tax=Halostella litorea TaxID=2528831 RepID=UPI002873B104|nr:hypothetical protein [Halostella litorea]